MKQTQIGILFFVMLASVVCSQGLTSEGREFYLGHLNASHTQVATIAAQQQYRVIAVISSYTDNEVSVSYFDPLTGKEEAPRTYTIAAYKSIEVPLDHQLMRATEPGDIAEYKSCHIVAKDPVAVHYFSFGASATGAYLALPVTVWGKSYVVASDPDNPGVGANLIPPEYQADLSNGCFMVIAGVNDTRVTITPNALTGGGHVGATQGPGSTGKPQPYTVTLQRGQCYLVKSVSAYSGNYDDISGSIVKADKPVAVIMGHENANVGDGTVRDMHATDARDFMIEQAIPWEFADTAYMTFPLEDAPGLLDGGQGEDIRLFVDEPPGSLAVGGCAGTYATLSPYPYNLPLASRSNVVSPQRFWSEGDKPFQVMQYELRSDGNSAPYPAPAMVSTVPVRQWRNAYLIRIPRHSGMLKYQQYYVTVTGFPDIYPPMRSEVQGWTCPEVAKTYKIEAGVTYFIYSGWSQFMVNVFGYIGIEEAPGIINYSAFSYPGGLRARARTKANMTTTLDTACKQWTLCATDHTGAGIKSILLAHDKHRIYTPFFFQAHHNYLPESYNCSLANATSLDGRELFFAESVTSACADIRVLDSSKNAHASIAITDGSGNVKFLDFHYDGQQVAVDSQVTVALTTIGVGDTVAIPVRLTSKNVFNLTSIELSDSSRFSLALLKPLPYTVSTASPYDFAVRYVPTDTFMSSTSIRLCNGCDCFEQVVSGKGSTGMIAAEDKQYGFTQVGSSKCRDVRITNVGSNTFRLMDAKVEGSDHYAIASDEYPRLPLAIKPGGSVFITVCHTPVTSGKDTASIRWITDIPEPYQQSVKSYSLLTGISESLLVRSDTLGDAFFYPNPSRRPIGVVDIRQWPPIPVSIVVFDLLGKEQYRTQGIGGTDVAVDIPSLVPGTYVVRVISTKKQIELLWVIH